jgi:RNA polymerase sigma-70 factor (ECF subfamily)
MSASTWSDMLVGLASGPAPADTIDRILADILRTAAAAWPTVELDPEAFVRHLGRHLPEGVALETALRQMNTSDLYLACACAQGDPRAIAAFETHCLSVVESAVTRNGVGSDIVAEVKQHVRERALVSDAGPPRIASFSGRGDLRGWVRVMATRESILLARRARRETPVDDEELLHAFVTPGDAELEQAKGQYRDEFKRAFDAALRSLPAREQTLLRQHVIDGLTIDQLGALYHVHRATAARNLERARQAVLAATRQQMMGRLRVRPSELDSILRLIRSKLEVSLRGLIRKRKD